MLLLVLLSVPCASAVYATGQITLQTDQNDFSAGYYRLFWQWAEAPKDIEYSLIEMTNRDRHGHGRELYAGPKLDSVFSDKPDGTYRYVVQALRGNQVLATSNPLKIIVTRRSPERIWIMYAVIAFIFISMLVIIRLESPKAS